MAFVKLRSSDNELVLCEIELMKCSGIFVEMLHACKLNEEHDVEMPVPTVKAKTLRLIVEWARHHAKDVVPLEETAYNDKTADNIPEWDVEFLKVDKSTLFDLIAAANYLDIQGLMIVSCKTVAKMIKSKTAEELRKCFDIENDLHGNYGDANQEI